MRYAIDESEMELPESLAVYHACVAWAAARCDGLELLIEPDIYDDPRELAALRALGRPSPPGPDQSADLERVVGQPGDAAVRALTAMEATPRANAGDLCPAMHAEFFASGRMLYGSYDYGRTQILDLGEAERGELERTLAGLGLDPLRIVAAPPHVSPR
jgi:hypothetical protein